MDFLSNIAKILLQIKYLKRRDRPPLDCGYYISFKNDRISRREFATKEECQAYVSSLGSSSGDVKETVEELAGLKLTTKHTGIPNGI